VAYGAYEERLRDLIHVLKYQGVRSAAPLLARLLFQAVEQAGLPESLVVVPVPLYGNKLRGRGFNQSEEIARALVRSYGSHEVRLNTSLLVRVRDTSSQTGLTRPQRRQNLRGAFAAPKPQGIQDRSILLVDDVVTTGATVAECARTLLGAGAKEVFVATVARAVRESELRLEGIGPYADISLIGQSSGGLNIDSGGRLESALPAGVVFHGRPAAETLST